MSKRYSNSFKATVNGHDIVIDNYFNSYNYGFSHTSRVYMDGLEVGERVVGYINRTWEAYAYQTSARGAAYAAIEVTTERMKRYFKLNNNISRLTKKYQGAFSEELEKSDLIKTMRAVISELDKGGCYGPLNMKRV